MVTLGRFLVSLGCLPLMACGSDLYELHVVIDGPDGWGSVISDAGIDCFPNSPESAVGNKPCSARIDSGTRVTLTAQDTVASTFSGWGRDCEGTNPAFLLVMDSDKECLAHFVESFPFSGQ